LLYDSHLDSRRWSGKVLYFAPEPSILPFLQRNSAVRIETADYMMEDVDHRIDIMNIPFEDASYDVILCHHVIEHVPDDRKALKELNRILKGHGILFLSVPIDLARVTTLEYAAPNPQFDDHYFCYGMDFKGRLQEVFPHVEEVRFSRIFTESQIKKHGFKDEIAYVCRRVL
jgi:SAM-dependent methyltransferase